MRLFKTPPYRDVPELLDSAGEATAHDLQQTLRDIRRANIFGLGTWVVKHHVSQIVRGWPNERTIEVLDIATGSADIPEEMCRWARKEGRRIHFVATDISPEILGVARRRIYNAGFGDQVDFLACDAVAPPFADKSFDIVICSLAFHHLTVGQARDAMQGMRRLAQSGFIINDVYRSQGAWYMAWFLTRVTTGNRLTRHDGPASVYRAFTPAELARLGCEAGVPLSISTYPFWRVAAVARTE